MTDITKDRYGKLRDWFDREGATFTTETALTVAAVADVQASGSEVDMVAMWWREKFRDSDQLDVDEEVLEATIDDIEDDPAVAATDIGAGAGDMDAHPGSTGQPPEKGGDPPAAALVPISPEEQEFNLDARRAKAYAMSGYWPDAASVARALVKVEAGRSLGLPPIVAMSEVHVIDGKPTLGAGALSTLVKLSGRYDYRVTELSEERCVIVFTDRHGEVIGDSVFTIDDAKKAGLLSRKGIAWQAYPRNMLFARAMSNGVAWFCPDVTAGRFYTPDEIEPVEEVAAPAA